MWKLCRAVTLSAAIALTMSAAASAPAAEHVVSVGNHYFDPADITVSPGDSVRWVWVEGWHTVTSAQPCAPQGDGLFHSSLDTFVPEFVWNVPSDQPDGEISYICLPHCNVGMIGTITVESSSSIPGDLDGNGVVNVGDMLILLSAWGDCPAQGACPEDLDGNGSVNVGDLLILLGNWG